MTDTIELVERALRQAETRMYGKHRAIVIDAADPQRLGRLLVTVPSRFADSEMWAESCFPYGGASGVGLIAIPPVGAGVFVEFVEGDPNSPIWTGCWARDALPDAAEPAPTVKLWRTAAGHMIRLDDDEGQPRIEIVSGKPGSAAGDGEANATISMGHEGGVSITDASGATITMDAAGSSITISDAAGNAVTLSSSGVDITDAAGNAVTLASSGVTVKAAQVKIEAGSVTLGQGAAEALVKGTSFMSAFNAHTHACTAPGSPSGPPLPPMTPAVLTIATTAA